MEGYIQDRRIDGWKRRGEEGMVERDDGEGKRDDDGTGGCKYG